VTLAKKQAADSTVAVSYTDHVAIAPLG